ncbi:membrane protein [Paenibacillus montaniterrae]|uniref:Membrane protein n=1 Tax=Paenibacillus montaniterrae TaxID=429341 RepID=A0A920CZ56_9BACL|nr:ImmA/IrrE family metallo-endopeptidase [Paenibacillus montaniterrae]GIP16689.1 membrane protein [Paenibacillus montaniterrae]
MGYENLLIQAEQQGLYIYEACLRSRAKGLIKNNIIAINKNIQTSKEKACILAEEIGHYHTAVGDFADQSKLENRKKERLGRAWAYERLIPLDRIIQAGQAGVEGRYAVAEYLEITEEFLQESIEHYQRKYGIHTMYQGYMIYFEPLSIIKL